MTPRTRILMVEDERDVARYLAAALEDAGFEVLMAADAEEGTALVRSQRPDLVCLDLIMPGRTGLSLYRELRETPGLDEVPIVVVSGLNAADAEDSLSLGETMPCPDAFVEKPVDLSRLIDVIRDLVAKRRD